MDFSAEEKTVFPIQVVGAALVDNLANPQRILVAQRSAPESLAGLWEFPGGKVETGETCIDALHRELQEELGINAELGQEISGPLPQGWQLNEKAAMRVWFAQVSRGVPTALEDHCQLRWMDLGRSILNLDWIPADLPIVEALLESQ